MQKRFKKKCAICKLMSDDIHKHHQIPKDDSTIIEICSNCHYKIHHPEWKQGDLEQFRKEFTHAIDENIFSAGWGIIPNKIIHDDSINSLAKLLYCEITSLCAERGYCWASNRYLAGKFGVTMRSITRAITQLEKYLMFENRGGAQRRIWVHHVKPGQKWLGYKPNPDKNVEHNSNTLISKKNTRDASHHANPSKGTPRMDDYDRVPTDSQGNELPQKKYREKKSGVALRLQKKFAELCEKQLETRPILDKAGYFRVLSAMNQGGLTEAQILDLFDEWFTLGKSDEDTISLTRALSNRQIEAYKIRNNVR